MDSLIGDYSNRSPFVRDSVDVMFYTDDELKKHNVFVRPDKLDEWIRDAVDKKIEREAE
jgi:Arc/MetJ-type ribon-helix-helix transcriptional regulator